MIVVGLLVPAAARADGARFDLAGPAIDVRVTRGGVSLPIAAVPNLQAGDQIWLHPDLPPTQSVHYLLIAVFLRGTTNPPPDEWFTRIETWKKEVREEGVTITVPAEAQQAILFLAPETGGDFNTLRSAVKGRPGIFVRASQDLTEAGFEQARIEKYIASMKMVPASDPAALLEHSNLLARTLNLKPNPDCFKRPVDQQYNCLTQTGSQSLLDDGHGQSLVDSLSSGPGSDFITSASTTQLAGGGTYSAYVGTLVDLVRIMNGIHTAQYQYIPAIAAPQDASLNLRLNTAPSFHNPKSVLVIGMPAIQKNQLPPLRPADPDHTACLLNPKLVLPVEGAPLVFSTSFAHDLVLHLNLPPNTGVPGRPDNLPLMPDAYQGGLTLAANTPARHELPPADAAGAPVPLKPAKPELKPAAVTGPITGTISGMWGFDHFTGPTLTLQAVPGSGWRIVEHPGAPANLIAGQPNHLEIASSGTACIESISLDPGKEKAEWKLAATPASSAAPTIPPSPPVAPVDLTLNLQKAATPGSLQLDILQFGQAAPDHLGTRSFAEPARLAALQLHAGDSAVELTGTGLDEVRQLKLKDAVFRPGKTAGESFDGGAPQPAAGSLDLELSQGAAPPAVKPGEKLQAQVELMDGRMLEIATVALPARPAVAILSRRVASPAPSSIQLSSPDELPLGAQLTFFLKSPNNFQRNEQIEIANADSSLETRLSVKDGALVMQDSHTVLASLDPLKTFGPSTFGPFRLRALVPAEGSGEKDGAAGDWTALTTIVRLPALTAVRCPADLTQPCQLAGSQLYLIDSVASTLAFTAPVKVPEGFVENTMTIPHLTGPSFYLRLRDDPDAVQTVTLPVQGIGPAVKGKTPGGVAPTPATTPAAIPGSTPDPS